MKYIHAVLVAHAYGGACEPAVDVRREIFQPGAQKQVYELKPCWDPTVLRYYASFTTFKLHKVAK